MAVVVVTRSTATTKGRGGGAVCQVCPKVAMLDAREEGKRGVGGFVTSVSDSSPASRLDCRLLCFCLVWRFFLFVRG